MNYQDVWLNGQLVKSGYRSCDARYQIIREFCRSRMSPGFSVCDIGANMGYFSIRLIEDFNACAVGFEFHNFKNRLKIIKKQRTDRFLYINRKLQLPDLEVMRHVAKFDLVLALSVLHHVPGEVGRWIYAMRKLGKYVIVELALSDSARTKRRKGYRIPYGGDVLGYGESHLDSGVRRPIIVFNHLEGV